MKLRVEEMIILISEMYNNMYEIDHLLSAKFFCLNARNLAPFDQLDGLSFEEDMWNSLCTREIEGNYVKDGGIWPTELKNKKIWRLKCLLHSLAYCF